MKGKSRLLMILAALAALAALYTLSGVLMNIQFALATENAEYAKAALLWGVGALLSVAGAVLLARAALRRREVV